MPFSYRWLVGGPGLFSVEDVANGYLGSDYNTACDGRWGDGIRLGPLMTTLDCSGAGGTAANATDIALSRTMNSTKFAYVIRGTKWAKIKLSDMSLVSDGTETALSEAATCVQYSASAGGVEMLSFGMLSTAFENITTVGNGATDTHSANNESFKFRIIRQGYPGNTYFGLGERDTTVANNVSSNKLTGSVTMDASSFSDRSTVSGEPIQFNSMCFIGNILVLGTSNGPYYLDDQFQEFRPMIPEVAQNATYNCLVLKTWSKIGGNAICSLAKGVVLISANGVEAVVGPEEFPFNTSPITSPMLAFTAGERWGYGVFYNVPAGDSYLCAIRDRKAGEPGGNLLSYYPLTKFPSTYVGFAEDIDTGDAARTNPTIMLGEDSDVQWFTEGRAYREIDDTNYTYASSGIAYLTETRRDAGMQKYIKSVEFFTSGCDANKTVKLTLTVRDPRLGGTKDIDICTYKTNGYHRFEIPDPLYADTIKPYFTLTTNSSSASPVVRDLTVSGDLLPMRDAV